MVGLGKSWWHVPVRMGIIWPLLGIILMVPGPCLTTATWRCRKNFSQWECSFHWKLRCHWLEFLQQRQIAVVTGPRVPFHKCYVKPIFAIFLNNTTLILMIQSGDNFAHAMTFQLAWYVPICDLIGSLLVMWEQHISLWELDYELINHISEIVAMAHTIGSWYIIVLGPDSI